MAVNSVIVVLDRTPGHRRTCSGVSPAGGPLVVERIGLAGAPATERLG